MNSVWILTEEYNAYDQYGEYFRAVFKDKPTAEQLKPYLDEHYPVQHVLDGGDRRGVEDNWYYLRQEIFK